MIVKNKPTTKKNLGPNGFAGVILPNIKEALAPVLKIFQKIEEGPLPTSFCALVLPWCQSQAKALQGTADQHP